MRMRKFRTVAFAAVAAAMAAMGSQARATEVFVGAYAHDVTFIGNTIGVGAAGRESGADLMLGVRSERIQSLGWLFKPQAHLFGLLNSDGTSDFVAAGLSWPIKISGPFYFRPGIGMGITSGKTDLPPTNVPGLSQAEFQRRLHLYETRIDFGSKVLFEPELGFGVHLNDRLSAEVNWVHFSNGDILNGGKGKNQGIDDAGARLIWRFGAH
jgi:hypothetical protein